MPDKETNNTENTFSPNAYYRKVHPEYFSDSKVQYDVPLTQELFDQQMLLLSTKKKQSQFENFVVAIAKRCITPNIKPQTGPDGGGDGKVDAETYEVSNDISDKWYSVENTASGKEYWAIAISCKTKWKPKVTSDVEKIVGTHREYTKVLFFTNQYIKSSTRADTEQGLSTIYNIDVKIYDANCISHWVFQNNCIDLALEHLDFSDDYKKKTEIEGPNDKARKERLTEIENNILRHIDGLDTEYIEKLQEACILSRELERPRTEVEGRFQRAISECKYHGTDQQLFNIIYDHAWTSYFWFEDITATYNDYLKLKDMIQEHCNVTRIEKFTNLHTNLQNAARAGNFSQELLDSEVSHLKKLSEDLKSNPDKSSSALYLAIYIIEQRLIEHILKGENIDTDIQAIKPLLIESVSHLEISIESHYKVIKMLSNWIEFNEQFENLVDDFAGIISEKRSMSEAAKIRLARAEDHLEKKRWTEAVKQLGFCVYAFEQENCITELIQSSGYMGMALNNLSLPYSAEAYLVKAASFLVQEFYHSGRVPHLLVTVLHELCGIELKLGRIIMYLNWFELLCVVSQNSQYCEEDSFKQTCQMEDAAWACRFAVSDLKDESVAKLPDILDRFGMFTSAEVLKYLLGYPEEVEESCLAAIKDICDSQKINEQPVFNQFLDKLNISTTGKVYLTTTASNFTFTIEYENQPQIQRIAELFLASIESFMATTQMFEIIPIENNVRIYVENTTGNTEIIFQENQNIYELRLNLDNFNDKTWWECFVKFIATFFSKNAMTRISIDLMLEKKQSGEKLLDRVSVLQRTEVALNNVLGNDYKCRLEDWCKDSDKVYAFKSTTQIFGEKTFYNKQQSAMTLYKINSNMNLWNDAGWNGCTFSFDPYFQHPPYFGLAFRNIEKGKAIVSDWESDFKVKIYIIKGINAAHPTWYRVCVTPVIPINMDTEERYVTATYRMHTMTPTTNENLKRFEQEYYKYGGCWLMAYCIIDDNTLVKPSSFKGAFKFSNIEIIDAYKIDSHNPARQALEPNDSPFIPETMKENAPVLQVLEELKNIIRNK